MNIINPCNILLNNIDLSTILSLIFLGFLSIIFVSAGCLSKTIEHVGSIISSNNTTCNGNKNNCSNPIFSSGPTKEDSAIGICITNI